MCIIGYYQKHNFTGDVEEEDDKVQSPHPDWVFRVPVRQVTHAGLLL